MQVVQVTKSSWRSNWSLDKFWNLTCKLFYQLIRRLYGYLLSVTCHVYLFHDRPITSRHSLDRVRTTSRNRTGHHKQSAQLNRFPHYSVAQPHRFCCCYWTWLDTVGGKYNSVCLNIAAVIRRPSVLFWRTYVDVSEGTPVITGPV